MLLLSEDGSEGFDFKLKAFLSEDSKIPNENDYNDARENLKLAKMASEADTFSNMGSVTPMTGGTFSVTPSGQTAFNKKGNPLLNKEMDLLTIPEKERKQKSR